jgi:hypothetical protein
MVNDGSSADRRPPPASASQGPTPQDSEHLFAIEPTFKVEDTSHLSEDLAGRRNQGIRENGSRWWKPLPG